MNAYNKLPVTCNIISLNSDLLEDIVDEGVHDSHGTLGDTGIGVDLTEDLEDIGGVGLGTLLGALTGLLVLTSGGLGRGLGGNRLLSSNHFDIFNRNWTIDWGLILC
mgnify:CR=1 FL=1